MRMSIGTARESVAWGIRGSLRIALQALTLVGLLVTVAGNVTFVSALKPGAMLMSLLLCLASALEALAWRRAGRFAEPGRGRLERSLISRAFALPGLTVALLVVAPGELSDVLIASACCALGASRLAFCVLHSNAQHHAARQMQRRRRTRARLEREGILDPAGQTQIALMKRPTVLETVVAKAIGALLLLLVGLALATFIEGATSGRWRVAPHIAAGNYGKAHTNGRDRGARQDRRGRATTGENRSAPNTVPAPLAPTTSSTATAPPESSRPCAAMEPAPEVSATTIREIERLLTLAGSGGAIGCGYTVNVTATSQGPIYWSTSSAPGDTTATPAAIAVIAPGQRRFVALAPAVSTVEQLIRAGRPIGSEREFARTYAGEGFFYVLLSEAGSTLLTKSSLSASGPLVVSPPPVASAIRSSDQQFGVWLWPSPPVPIGPHEVLYSLAARERGPIVERIRYDAVRNTAWRGSSRHPIRYVSRQRNLVLWELRAWIPERPMSEVRLEAEIERDED
jgi:hypothetical protein